MSNTAMTCTGAAVPANALCGRPISLTCRAAANPPTAGFYCCGMPDAGRTVSWVDASCE
jgi:hypothetical protein